LPKPPASFIAFTRSPKTLAGLFSVRVLAFGFKNQKVSGLEPDNDFPANTNCGPRCGSLACFPLVIVLPDGLLIKVAGLFGLCHRNSPF
jgi:hypothetical protein